MLFKTLQLHAVCSQRLIHHPNYIAIWGYIATHVMYILGINLILRFLRCRQWLLGIPLSLRKHKGNKSLKIVFNPFNSDGWKKGIHTDWEAKSQVVRIAHATPPLIWVVTVVLWLCGVGMQMLRVMLWALYKWSCYTRPQLSIQIQCSLLRDLCPGRLSLILFSTTGGAFLLLWCVTSGHCFVALSFAGRRA